MTWVRNKALIQLLFYGKVTDDTISEDNRFDSIVSHAFNENIGGVIGSTRGTQKLVLENSLKPGYTHKWKIKRVEIYRHNGSDLYGNSSEIPNDTEVNAGATRTFECWDDETWKYLFYVSSKVGITFYIVFSWHGGSERQNDKTFGNTYQLLGVKTAPAGYTHTGWYNDLMGHKSLSANVVFNFYAGDVAISATYTAKTYTLAYSNDTNKGTTSGGEGAGTKTFDVAYTLPTVTAKAGYTFVDWTGQDSKTSGGSYTWTTAGNITWTANYKAKTYTLAYSNAGTSTGGTAAGNVSYKGGYTLPTASPPTGYTFSSWSSTQGTTTTNGDNYTWDTVGDLTWTANYTINKYTATFNANNKGTGTTKTQDYATSVALPTLKAVGYAFAGWATTNTATTADVTAAFNMPVDGRTLYAVWTENANKTVSFSELQTVFGGSDPISMSEYRTESGKTGTTEIKLSGDLKGKGPAPP
jgi:uncharacterized repeat protein (TIGR02543 family)